VLTRRAVCVQGKHDNDEKCSECWGNVWQTVASSSEQALRLYLTEVVDAVCKCMDASSWAIRGQSARALACASQHPGALCARVRRV
jgi:hypothetical protein